MKLKKLPKDVHYLIHMCLDLRSLLKMKITDKYFNGLVFQNRAAAEKNIWMKQAKNLGIYQDSFKRLETEDIIALIKTHVTQVHGEVKAITENVRIKHFNIDSSALTFAILQDDDTEVTNLLKATSPPAKNKFIPLMIQLGRIRCLKSVLKD